MNSKLLLFEIIEIRPLSSRDACWVFCLATVFVPPLPDHSTSSTLSSPLVIITIFRAKFSKAVNNTHLSFNLLLSRTNCLLREATSKTASLFPSSFSNVNFLLREKFEMRIAEPSQKKMRLSKRWMCPHVHCMHHIQSCSNLFDWHFVVQSIPSNCVLYEVHINILSSSSSFFLPPRSSPLIGHMESGSDPRLRWHKVCRMQSANVRTSQLENPAVAVTHCGVCQMSLLTFLSSTMMCDCNGRYSWQVGGGRVNNHFAEIPLIRGPLLVFVASNYLTISSCLSERERRFHLFSFSQQNAELSVSRETQPILDFRTSLDSATFAWKVMKMVKNQWRLTRAKRLTKKGSRIHTGTHVSDWSTLCVLFLL